MISGIISVYVNILLPYSFRVSLSELSKKWVSQLEDKVLFLHLKLLSFIFKSKFAMPFIFCQLPHTLERLLCFLETWSREHRLYPTSISPRFFLLVKAPCTHLYLYKFLFFSPYFFISPSKMSHYFNKKIVQFWICGV